MEKRPLALATYHEFERPPRRDPIEDTFSYQSWAPPPFEKGLLTTEPAPLFVFPGAFFLFPSRGLSCYTLASTAFPDPSGYNPCVAILSYTWSSLLRRLSSRNLEIQAHPQVVRPELPSERIRPWAPPLRYVLGSHGVTFLNQRSRCGFRPLSPLARLLANIRSSAPLLPLTLVYSLEILAFSYLSFRCM